MQRALWCMLAVLTSVAGCARSSAPTLLLTPQTRVGLGEGYGPGIVSANARAMRFELATRAHVIALRVTQDGIQQVSPGLMAGRERTIEPGTHWVKVAEPGRRRDATGLDPADLPSGRASLSCVPILDPNLNAKPDPGCVERVARDSGPRPLTVGRDGRPKVSELGYWLLIVSDARTTADELRTRLLGYEANEDQPDDFSLLAVVQELPGILVGGRTTNWAAYYVGFAEVHTARR